ncbi:MAG: BASS family bile acid:Na+ symporter [Cellvibrionaceae bacterium]|jgi:BASS family bile acid:Na+ symporter
MDVDSIALNFNPTTLFILNLILGFVMFGVALDMTFDDFRGIKDRPRSFLIGMVCQFFILPALTFLLVLLLKPAPSVGLGMILVSSCPGGNISNFFTHLSKGNTALSVSMSAVSTVAALFMTPFNFSFWGSMVPGAQAILSEINVTFFQMAQTIFILMLVPLAIGMFIRYRFPSLADKMLRPMKIFSMTFFLAFVALALAGNWSNFVNHVDVIFLAVLIMNGIALALGYSAASLFRLPEADRRAVALEVGIQNSGLGLILIFNFFGGLGGMALIAGWWGIWHIITGYAMGYIWSRTNPNNGNIVGLA